MNFVVISLWSLAFMAVPLEGACPDGTFYMIDRCCVDVKSRAGEQPVICRPSDPWSSSVEPCPDDTFSMDGGWLSNRDVCSLKTRCTLPHMLYRHAGSRIQDAVCKCEQGYFLTEEPHNCVRNPVCPIGYGQDNEGGCLDCTLVGRFSDRADRDQPCLQHKQCGFGMCEIANTTSTSDRLCGKCFKDTDYVTPATSHPCSQPQRNVTSGELTTTPKPLNDTNNGITEGGNDDPFREFVLPSILGVICLVGLVVVVAVICTLVKRRRVEKRKKKYHKQLTRCRNDSDYRNRVIDSAVEVLRMNLGKKWKTYCFSIFKDAENRATIHETLLLDHNVYGTENIIQEMILKFKRHKYDDSDSVDILFNALVDIGRDELIDKIIDKFEEKDSGDIELQIM